MSKPASEAIALPFHDEAAAAQPIVRPTNHARSLFHVTSGVAALLLLAALRKWPPASTAGRRTLTRRTPGAAEA